MLTLLLAIAASTAASWVGYTTARSFVRQRLRFVDAALTWWAPILAGLATAVVATPIAAILPLIGGGTAIVLGLSVGLGVASGQKDIRALSSGY